MAKFLLARSGFFFLKFTRLLLTEILHKLFHKIKYSFFFVSFLIFSFSLVAGKIKKPFNGTDKELKKIIIKMLSVNYIYAYMNKYMFKLMNTYLHFYIHLYKRIQMYTIFIIFVYFYKENSFDMI